MVCTAAVAQGVGKGKTELYLKVGGVARGCGGGVYSFMRNRSFITINPRIRTVPGRSTRVFTEEANIAGTKREAA